MTPMHDEIYMQRCLQLAALAAGHVAPNPMVGAVLVHEGRIIGEGYHRQYGQAHAEVNCLASVGEADRHLVPQSTMYVSLEPCAHHGKTPPCADLIIAHNIPRVVVGCRDPFVAVDGKGIDKLKNAGVDVRVGLLEDDCRSLNKRFLLFHTEHRPYIVLKWAQTADQKIARGNRERLSISHAYANRLVHRWRSEEAAILVGTGTALQDNPQLNTRLWPGPDPVRLVIDKELKLPPSHHLLDGTQPTIVFNRLRHSLPEERFSFDRDRFAGLQYYQLSDDTLLTHQLIQALYRMNILSVLVEGGAFLLQSFIDEELWDEARIITNESMFEPGGLPAPVLHGGQLTDKLEAGGDVLHFYRNGQQKRTVS